MIRLKADVIVTHRPLDLEEVARTPLPLLAMSYVIETTLDTAYAQDARLPVERSSDNSR